MESIHVELPLLSRQGIMPNVAFIDADDDRILSKELGN